MIPFGRNNYYVIYNDFVSLLDDLCITLSMIYARWQDQQLNSYLISNNNKSGNPKCFIPQYLCDFNANHSSLYVSL